MLRESLKQEIDQLSESQLEAMAEFMALLKQTTQPSGQPAPFWQQATPAERAEDFRAWVNTLPLTQRSLPDEAFDRGNIYE